MLQKRVVELIGEMKFAKTNYASKQKAQEDEKNRALSRKLKPRTSWQQLNSCSNILFIINRDARDYFYDIKAWSNVSIVFLHIKYCNVTLKLGLLCHYTMTVVIL